MPALRLAYERTSELHRQEGVAPGLWRRCGGEANSLTALRATACGTADIPRGGGGMEGAGSMGDGVVFYDKKKRKWNVTIDNTGTGAMVGLGSFDDEEVARQILRAEKGILMWKGKHLLLGRTVRKHFPGHGVYDGKVSNCTTSTMVDSGEVMFQINYADETQEIWPQVRCWRWCWWWRCWWWWWRCCCWCSRWLCCWW